MSIHTDRDTGLEHGVVTYTVPRVNLLPDEVHEARRLRRTQLAMGGCVVAVLAALGAGYVVLAGQTDAAADELAAEQARTDVLRAEESEYAEVPRIMAQVDSAKSAQATAMANDVLWYRYLNDLALTYPAEVWLTNLTATVAGPTTAVAPVAGADPLATPGVGSLTVSGKALAHSDVASWLDVLAGTPGFADAGFSNSTLSEVGGQSIVEFSSDAVVTGDALSHRFDQKAN
ncbi:PilN domain-containing protein [Thalassiella azotivora]